ncbi:hypothetical protein FJW10_17825 [Mesorhizobium sp. B4-1-1]|nr:hypothetical protein FJW10_17825 [Mesorhizobium sp. B4-1-1]
MPDSALGVEIFRFACATGAGLLLSVGLAAILTDLAGCPSSAPVALASILVPVLNFAVLRKFVFLGGGRMGANSSLCPEGESR